MKIPNIVGFFALLLLLTSPVFGQASEPPALSADEVAAMMVTRDAQRESLGRGYTGNRRYILDNQRMYKRAEMQVTVKCDADGTKHFEVLSEEGWKSANKHVLRKMLESEAETSRTQTRPTTRVTPSNYVFQMLGSELVEARPAYVIQVLPKRRDKYLFEGRIWVDAEDYALVRAEGRPAENPSFWTRSVYFVHRYQKAGLFWFPSSTESTTEARIFGTTQVTIKYFDYLPNAEPAQNFSSNASAGVNDASHTQY
jgi:hypothetical protein